MVSEQVNQLLGSQIYTWAELMSILRILFSGEERPMIQGVAMAIWECEHPPRQNVLVTDAKFTYQETQ
jgi:methylthioribose-1-phosphate isomerase